MLRNTLNKFSQEELTVIKKASEISDEVLKIKNRLISCLFEVAWDCPITQNANLTIDNLPKIWEPINPYICTRLESIAEIADLVKRISENEEFTRESLQKYPESLLFDKDNGLFFVFLDKEQLWNRIHYSCSEYLHPYIVIDDTFKYHMFAIDQAFTVFKWIIAEIKKLELEISKEHLYLEEIIKIKKDELEMDCKALIKQYTKLKDFIDNIPENPEINPIESTQISYNS